MLGKRGVNVDHTTVYRWVQFYALEMEKRLRWYWRNPSGFCSCALMKPTRRSMGSGLTCTVPLTVEDAPSIFISLRAVTAKRHIGFWVKFQTM